MQYNLKSKEDIYKFLSQIYDFIIIGSGILDVCLNEFDKKMKSHILKKEYVDQKIKEKCNF